MHMKYIVANFKMNPQKRTDARVWMEQFRAWSLRDEQSENISIVLCPPFVWLPLFGLEDDRSRNYLGAQDIFWEDSGAFTGEISGKMLKNSECAYVIIGHSERRALGETDEIVNKKIKAALAVGLTPILAVGERTRSVNRMGIVERETSEVLDAQLKGALVGVSKANLKSLIVAYEPVWAVGTGIVDTPEDALKAALTIRKTVAEISGYAKLRKSLPVLYGGSVSAKNAGPFLKEDGLDGVLVGGASLDVKEFLNIVATADRR